MANWQQALQNPLFWGGMGILGADPRQGASGMLKGAMGGMLQAQLVQNYAAEQKLKERSAEIDEKKLRILESEENRAIEKARLELEEKKAQSEAWTKNLEAINRFMTPESEGGEDLTLKERRRAYGGLLAIPGLGSTERTEAAKGLLNAQYPPFAPFGSVGNSIYSKMSGEITGTAPRAAPVLNPSQQRAARENELIQRYVSGTMGDSEQQELNALMALRGKQPLGQANEDPSPGGLFEGESEAPAQTSSITVPPIEWGNAVRNRLTGWFKGLSGNSEQPVPASAPQTPLPSAARPARP